MLTILVHDQVLAKLCHFAVLHICNKVKETKLHAEVSLAHLLGNPGDPVLKVNVFIS